MGRTDAWFIEQTGLGAEADGLSRTAGRLFGALLLSAEPQSLDALVATLGVSKASVSIEARRLVERGVIERAAHPGDQRASRRDYYQVVPDFFTRLVRSRVDRWATLRALAVQLRDADPDRPAVVRARLDEIEAIHDFVVTRVDEALREWQACATRDVRAADTGTRAAGRSPAGDPRVRRAAS